MQQCGIDNCPIVGLVDIFEKKWALRIVKQIYSGNSHFNELKRSMKGVTAAVLSKRLKELEKAGVVRRKELKGKKADVEYKLGNSAEHLMDCWTQHKTIN